MKTIAMVILGCVVAVGCGRKATLPSACVPVSTNAALPSVRQPELAPPVAVQEEVVVSIPSSVDRREEERKRVQRMALIDDRKKVDQPGQPPPAN